MKTEVDLYQLFENASISYKVFDHEPTHKVEQSKLLKDHIPGAHTKNLFLYNRKDEYFLITMMNDKQLDIKSFQKSFNRGRLSFASERRLWESLGVKPGSVTPFSIINDSKLIVQVILDQDMMDHELLNFHPLRNDKTVNINKDDLTKFFKLTRHEPLILKLPKSI